MNGFPEKVVIMPNLSQVYIISQIIDLPYWLEREKQPPWARAGLLPGSKDLTLFSENILSVLPQKAKICPCTY